MSFSVASELNIFCNSFLEMEAGREEERGGEERGGKGRGEERE